MSELAAGDLVDNRYTVERLLGRGGMAAVYLVRHRTLGSFHALKVLELDRPSVRKRLIREGAVQSRFRHPNLVAVTDAIEVDGKAALVMEYVHGPNLATVIESGRLGLDEVDAVAAGVFDGLEAAHRQSIVHRDLKPHNVLMSIDEHGVVPKVADFGLVKVLDEDGESAQTRTGMVFGTPEYMAPEQIRNAKGVDERADIFSLGVMLYEMVCGERPFGGGDLLATLARVTNDERKPLRELAPDAPERMIAAVERALVADRDNRVKTVAELRALWFQQAPRTTPAWNRDLLLSLVDPLPTVPSEPGGPATLAKSSVTATRSHTTPEVPRPAGATAVPVPVPVTANTGMYDPAGGPKGSETVDFGSLDAVAARPAAPITVMAEPPPAAPAPSPAPKAAPAPSISEFELQQRPSATKWLVPALAGLVLVALLAVVGVVGGLGLLAGGPPAPVEPPPVDDPPIVADPTPPPVEPPPVEPPPVEPPAEAPVDPTPKVGKITPPPTAPPKPVEPPPAPVETPVVTAIDPPPPPKPTGPPPRVRVEGADQMTVVLRDAASGKHVPPSDASVGTYEIVAFFEPNVPTIVKTVTLDFGAVVTVRCSLAGKRCVVAQ